MNKSNITSEMIESIAVKSFMKKGFQNVAVYVKKREEYKLVTTDDPHPDLALKLSSFDALLARVLDLPKEKIETTGYLWEEDVERPFVKIFGIYTGITGIETKLQTPKLFFASDTLKMQVEDGQKKLWECPQYLFDDDESVLWELEGLVKQFILGVRKKSEQMELPFPTGALV